jgi:hypothetical protein
MVTGDSGLVNMAVRPHAKAMRGRIALQKLREIGTLHR